MKYVSFRDTAGKSRFESLGGMFLSEAMGAMFCFDITDRKSFTNLSHWMSKMLGTFLYRQVDSTWMKKHQLLIVISQIRLLYASNYIIFIGKPKTPSCKSIPFVIVGCKVDLGDEKRIVTKYEAQEFAIKHGARYALTISLL